MLDAWMSSWGARANGEVGASPTAGLAAIPCNRWTRRLQTSQTPSRPKDSIKEHGLVMTMVSWHPPAFPRLALLVVVSAASWREQDSPQQAPRRYFLPVAPLNRVPLATTLLSWPAASSWPSLRKIGSIRVTLRQCKSMRQVRVQWPPTAVSRIQHLPWCMQASCTPRDAHAWKRFTGMPPTSSSKPPTANRSGLWR